MQKRLFLFIATILMSVSIASANNPYNETDYVSAAVSLQKSAENGDSLAMKNLGMLYLMGQGVEQSDERALYWYKRAADSGMAEAQYQTGLMMIEGRGTDQNMNMAYDYIKRSADQGYPPALTMMNQQEKKNIETLIPVKEKVESSYSPLHLKATESAFNDKHKVQRHDLKNEDKIEVQPVVLKDENILKEDPVLVGKGTRCSNKDDGCGKVGDELIVPHKVEIRQDETTLETHALPPVEKMGKQKEPARLQIAAYNHKKHAEKGWKILSDKYPTLQKYSHEISHETIKKGTFYRLYVTGQKNELTSVCSYLKSMGQDCIIRSSK